VRHFSSVFGRDVGNVRIRLNDAVASEHDADAVAMGDEVHVAPGVHLDKRLAAHEVAHVVQQSGGGNGLSMLPSRPMRRKPDDLESTGDEPLDPFVTGWSSVPAAVLVVRTANNLGIVPLRNAVYVPDPATAARFDPRVPRKPGVAPVFGVPAIGAAGTRVIPAGRRSAIVMDAGAGKGVSVGMYLSQFAGSLRSVGVQTSAEIFILPIHAHADHVDQIVNLIRTYAIPSGNILIPRGLAGVAQMRDVMDALTTRARGDTVLTNLGYGPNWKPVALTDRGTGPEVIRLTHSAPGGVKIELIGLRSAIETARTTGQGIDLASYIARITHPDRTKTVVLGDLRGADLARFRDAMERERPGSWAAFFEGASRLSGFSHHVGRLAAGDARGIMALLEVTVLSTGKVEIIEQTNLGQFGGARRDTLELAARIGAVVSTAEQPTTGQQPATRTSAVVATGTTVGAHGPDARVRATIPSQLTAGLQRIIQLDLAERTISDWRPVLDDRGQRAEVDELLREISASRAQLRSALAVAVEAGIAVRTGGTRRAGSPVLDYSAGTAGSTYAAALAGIPASTAAEDSITPRGFEELQKLRELPASDVPVRVALQRAALHGEYSETAFRAMLSSLSPGAARSLITGPRGGMSGKAFERVRAQWFLESSVMPMPDTVSTSGFSPGGRMAARGVAGGLLLIELVNQVGVPLWQSIKLGQMTAKKRDLYDFARRILFWAQMGAKPSVMGVEDPFFSWSPSRTRGFDAVMKGLQEQKWDAVVIESPGLSDADVMIVLAFLSQNVRNYDEYWDLFGRSGQDAVRSVGTPWEDATWEIRVGDYDTTLVNQVEERWEKHDRLTQAMRALVPRWIANTEEHLDRFGRREKLSDADLERLGTFSHAAPWAPPPPLYQARLKTPTKSTKVRKATISQGENHPQPYIEHTVVWNTPPRFFVHEEVGKYLLVSGADFNTYASILPLWTEGWQLGLPYSTKFRVANEDATCLIEPALLERISEPPKPMPVPGPQMPLWIEQRIYFRFREKVPRSDPDYDFTIPLDETAGILRDNPTVRIRVIGHTDNVGELRTNEVLSLARAEAVKALLVTRGIGEDRLVAEGAGAGAPIATNATTDGRARNRRVEFRAVPP
jgi:hypothetical protein